VQLFISTNRDRRSATIILLASALIATFCAHAQSRSRSLNPSVQFYAKTFHVSYAEAARRFAKEDSVAPLQNQMRKDLPDAFAGVYIEHQPKHQVVVLFTHDPQVLLARYTKDPFYVAKLAPRPLELLEAVQEEIVDQLAQTDVAFFGGIRVETSEIEIEAMDVAAASRALSGLLAAFDFIKVKKADALPEPLDIQGGMKAYAVTSVPGQPGRQSTIGFNVVDGSRELGITSAGHSLDNITRIDGIPVSLSFQDENYTGSYDFQWHKQNADPSASYPYLPQPNEILTPTIVEITGTTASSSMMPGQVVCKYGITTQNTCGRIDQINALVRNRRDGTLG